MTILIFIGDMLVTAFMVGLAAWFFYRDDDQSLDRVARIPLEDEDHDG